mmetsp:Transcript_9154/g.6956  ORF Transcript_9154/g.6956 Transcript_9154/m.6956 type:complete len:120 (-) Transcript_9154:36-395(-)
MVGAGQMHRAGEIEGTLIRESWGRHPAKLGLSQSTPLRGTFEPIWFTAQGGGTTLSQNGYGRSLRNGMTVPTTAPVPSHGWSRPNAQSRRDRRNADKRKLGTPPSEIGPLPVHSPQGDL